MRLRIQNWFHFHKCMNVRDNIIIVIIIIYLLFFVIIT